MDCCGGFLQSNVKTDTKINFNRTILHSDLNNFYASVECISDSSLLGKPVAVCGDKDARHGIVLAKNNLAKRYGVITAEAIWQAKKKCPDLQIIQPNYEKYLGYSNAIRSIYREYSPQVEGFGLDECWIDVSGTGYDGHYIADKIRNRISRETGLTVSVGVSFNKIFSKLGSDMKKPDATTVISKDDFKEKIWGLNANELIFVGRSTYGTLLKYGIITIGDLASVSPDFLKKVLGKNGLTLWAFANGYDVSPVQENDEGSIIKTIGNSMTTPRDVVSDEDARIVIYKLCDKVAGRLREAHFKGETVQVHIRDFELETHEFQRKLEFPTDNSEDLARLSLALYFANKPVKPVRSIGVRVSDLCAVENEQLSFFTDIQKSQKISALESEIDGVRAKYGKSIIKRGIMLVDNDMNRGVVQGIM